MVAKRYGKLPSETLKYGNTIDVQCADLAIQYESYLHKKANDEANGKIHTEHSDEELLNMISRAEQTRKERMNASNTQNK